MTSPAVNALENEASISWRGKDVFMGVMTDIKETLLFWLINFPVRSSMIDEQRWRLLRLTGVNIRHTRIMGPVDFGAVGKMDQIKIGMRSFINSGLRISVTHEATVSIGEDCAIGPNVSLETAGHSLIWEDGTRGHHSKSISIGEKCWIGAGAMILGGVTVGEGSVVAAGAVVIRDVEPFTLVGGTPARLIRKLK